MKSFQNLSCQTLNIKLPTTSRLEIIYYFLILNGISLLQSAELLAETLLSLMAATHGKIGATYSLNIMQVLQVLGSGTPMTHLHL